MNAALRTGIYTLGKTVTGLSATNLFYRDAKHTQESSFCVFWGVTNTQFIDSGTQFEIDNVQFDFFGTNLSSLETIVLAFKTMFDYTSSLTVTGYTVMSVTRSLERPAQKFDKVWQISLEYEIITSKSRS